MLRGSSILVFLLLHQYCWPFLLGSRRRLEPTLLPGLLDLLVGRTSRPTAAIYRFADVAISISRRSTCSRRAHGCCVVVGHPKIMRKKAIRQMHTDRQSRTKQTQEKQLMKITLNNRTMRYDYKDGPFHEPRTTSSTKSHTFYYDILLRCIFNCSFYAAKARFDLFAMSYKASTLVKLTFVFVNNFQLLPL